MSDIYNRQLYISAAEHYKDMLRTAEDNIRLRRGELRAESRLLRWRRGVLEVLLRVGQFIAGHRPRLDVARSVSAAQQLE